MGSHGNGLYSSRANLAAVALPQNAVIVMATASAVAGGGGPREEAGPGRSLSLTSSGQLLLSPSLPGPPSTTASSPPSSSSSPPAPPPVTTLSLTLLPSPVIGSLLLTPSSCSSPPNAPATSPPSPRSALSPCPPPPAVPPAFDPDSFLNSPKQGETYGGLLPPPSSGLSSLLCSSSPFSPVSLSLSLSPPSTPPSSVSPHSSSSCETDRRGSSSLPPAVPLSPSSSVAPPLLPLCLELSALGDSEGAGGGVAEGVDDEMKGGEGGRAPPPHLPQVRLAGSSPPHPTGSGVASLLLAGPPLRSGQTRQQAEPGPASHQPSVLQRGPPDTAVSAAPAAIAFEAGKTPTEVKQEMRPGYDMEEACMDTQLEGGPQEVDQCEQGGEELDISFDSQFPDLMSDLITDEAPPVADPPNPSAAAAPHPSVFPMGVRYMVPPQPSPSSSFLPFPHPLPASSSGLASITDFSPEWSYPEVSRAPLTCDQQGAALANAHQL